MASQGRCGDAGRLALANTDSIRPSLGTEVCPPTGNGGGKGPREEGAVTAQSKPPESEQAGPKGATGPTHLFPEDSPWEPGKAH